MQDDDNDRVVRRAREMANRAVRSRLIAAEQLFALAESVRDGHLPENLNIHEIGFSIARALAVSLEPLDHLEQLREGFLSYQFEKFEYDPDDDYRW